MTARVSRNEHAMSALMASECEAVMTESILPLMQRSGIKKIEIKKLESALSTRLIPFVEYFDGVPDKFKMFSELAKYPISEIMALMGVVSVDIHDATEQEVATIVSNCNKIVEASEQPKNSTGSGQTVKINSETAKKVAESVGKQKSIKVCSKNGKNGKCSCSAPKKQ